MDIPSLVRTINAQHRTSFAPVERYQSGEQGAFALVDATGRHAVLKWSRDTRFVRTIQDVMRTTDTLRLAGYPAPHYLFTGMVEEGAYAIQESLPGVPLYILTPHYLTEVLALNDMQVGRAVMLQNEWPTRVVNTVLYGGDGYCVIETLRMYSSTTAELLHVLQAVVNAHRDDDYMTNDIVHYDFHCENILISDNHISGVIDWDGTCSGDAGFDLVTLLCYAYTQHDGSVKAQLWSRALERSGSAAIGVYIAHMLVRQIDWAIRFQPYNIALWLRIASELLQQIEYL